VGAQSDLDERVGEFARFEEPRFEPDRVLRGDERAAPQARGIELADDEDAAGTDDASGLRDGGPRVRHVVERVRHRDGVHGGVDDRETRRVATNDGEALRLGLAEHPRGRVDHGHVELGEGGRGPPRSARDVQHRRDGPVGVLEPGA